MDEFLKTVGTGWLLPTMGACAVLLILLTPIVLKLAGLTGEQIGTVIRETGKFVIELIKAFRNDNNSKSNG